MQLDQKCICCGKPLTAVFITGERGEPPYLPEYLNECRNGCSYYEARALDCVPVNVFSMMHRTDADAAEWGEVCARATASRVELYRVAGIAGETITATEVEIHVERGGKRESVAVIEAPKIRPWWKLRSWLMRKVLKDRTYAGIYDAKFYPYYEDSQVLTPAETQSDNRSTPGEQ